MLSKEAKLAEASERLKLAEEKNEHIRKRAESQEKIERSTQDLVQERNNIRQ